MDKVVHRLRSVSAREIAPPCEEALAPVIACDAMRRLYELVTRAARTDLSVVILGETGSGKELVARALHERSARANRPFKAINCATLPLHLVESVLFGHERGAFTGADRQTSGVFEQAHGGTVFLDEVGELSGHAQASLLRALEQKRIVRVGGTREVELDVRVVAATHCDLEAMVRAGTFRMDLLFRLDAFSLRVPPLRERREEIPFLVDLFLSRARQRWGATAHGISAPALEALQACDWPGNVRQLRNAIECASALCIGERLELEHLPEQLRAPPPRRGDELPLPAVDELLDKAGREDRRALPERVRDFELLLILDALEQAGGNQAHAARLLGVPRRTLAHKVRAHALLRAGKAIDG